MNLKFSIFFFAASVFFCPSFGQPAKPLEIPFKSIIIAVGPFTTSSALLIKIQKILPTFNITHTKLFLKHFLKDGPLGVWAAEYNKFRINNDISAVNNPRFIENLYRLLLEVQKDSRKSKDYRIQETADALLDKGLEGLREVYLPKDEDFPSQNLPGSIEWPLLKTMFEIIRDTGSFNLVAYPYRNSEKSEKLIVNVESIKPSDTLVIYGHHTAYKDLLEHLLSLNLTNSNGQKIPILLVVPRKLPFLNIHKSDVQKTLVSINTYMTSLPSYLNSLNQKIDLITFSDDTNLQIALHEWLNEIRQ